MDVEEEVDVAFMAFKSSLACLKGDVEGEDVVEAPAPACSVCSEEVKITNKRPELKIHKFLDFQLKEESSKFSKLLKLTSLYS